MNNTIKKNLRDHKSSQCHVVIRDNGNTIDFISYVTRVITIKKDSSGRRTIECTGTYSQTTRKQIGWFLQEYAPDLHYFDMKKIAGMGVATC